MGAELAVRGAAEPLGSGPRVFVQERGMGNGERWLSVGAHISGAPCVEDTLAHNKYLKVDLSVARYTSADQYTPLRSP
jgi:hypothetical protein